MGCNVARASERSAGSASRASSISWASRSWLIGWNFLAVVMNAARTALPAGVADPLERYPE